MPQFSQQSNEAAQSDQELEATGKSWLKSSSPVRKSLLVTLPSIGETTKSNNYSRDSLDSSTNESYSKKSRYGNKC